MAEGRRLPARKQHHEREREEGVGGGRLGGGKTPTATLITTARGSSSKLRLRWRGGWVGEAEPSVVYGAARVAPLGTIIACSNGSFQCPVTKTK
jgi:hypothetical protein